MFLGTVKGGCNIKRLASFLFSPQKLIEKREKLGEIPDARSAYSTVFEMAWPAVIETVLIATISIINMVMVGGLGSYAITAVGITTQPQYIFMAAFFAKNVAVTAIIARRKGEGDRKSANICFRQATLITVAGSLILTALGVIFARQIVVLAGAEADTVEHAASYFRIVISAFFFTSISGNISAAQRGAGFPKISMQINLTANIVNIILNYFLIYGRLGFPALGVRGAAFSTAVGSVVGFLVALLSLRGQDGFLHIHRGQDWRPDTAMLKTIWFIGKSALLEQAAVRIGFFAFARIIATLGTQSFASYQIVMQLLNLSFTFGEGLNISATSLVGQNLGKKRPDLAMLYAKISVRVGNVISFLLILTFVFLRRQLVGIFTDEQELINMTAPLMLIIAAGMPMQVVQPIYGGALRGGGDVRYVAYTMLLSIMLIRPGVTALCVFALGTGVAGAFIAFVVDQAIRCSLLAARFRRGKWTTIKI